VPGIVPLGTGGPPDAGVVPDGVGDGAVCASNDIDAPSATVNIKPEMTPCVCIDLGFHGDRNTPKCECIPLL
jgi:hypothetical protein